MFFSEGNVVKLRKGYSHPLVKNPNDLLFVFKTVYGKYPGAQTCTLRHLNPMNDVEQWDMDSDALELVVSSLVRVENPNAVSEKTVVDDTVTGGSTPKQYRRSINLPLSDNREEFVNVDIEAMDIIDEWDLSFNLGNIAKACIRLDKKDSIDDLYDLNKIIFFAIREKKKRGLITHEQFWEYVEAMK